MSPPCRHRTTGRNCANGCPKNSRKNSSKFDVLKARRAYEYVSRASRSFLQLTLPSDSGLGSPPPDRCTFLYARRWFGRHRFFPARRRTCAARTPYDRCPCRRQKEILNRSPDDLCRRGPAQTSSCRTWLYAAGAFSASADCAFRSAAAPRAEAFWRKARRGADNSRGRRTFRLTVRARDQYFRRPQGTRARDRRNSGATEARFAFVIRHPRFLPDASARAARANRA